ncbi:ubiquitin, partial [Lactobacillus delbrueckii subsp. bulgaricus]|nr:ubiquitin [Lactobacillus delbrueckii subsp. bulgaricus]
AIFKINIRTSIMNITMQWSLWLKIPFLIMCILAYMYFWYALFKEIKDSL